MRGDVATVRALIARRADVNAPQGDGMTALHWAADRGDSAMATRVAAREGERGVANAHWRVHAVAHRGEDRQPRSRARAARRGERREGHDGERRHRAPPRRAAAGNPDVVKALLAKGADPNARESVWGQTPLVFAAEYGRRGRGPGC